MTSPSRTISADETDGYSTSELLEYLRDKRQELAFYLEQERALKKIEGVIKERIKEEVEETGEIGDVLVIEGARVHVKPGITKRVWDDITLISLLPHYPDISQALSEKTGRPRLWVYID